eukprot:XP_011680887.1 PREDICTED: E3 ubiquitin-protein ligase Midline-1-like [Strongylocentrotus purpuratus]
MAEKQVEEDVPNPSQSLTCPLCLGIFDDATLLTSCGHTFCRPCLRKYDLSHQDLDHMVCPLCRAVTKLSTNRVDDLLPNVTVNGLVDDHRARSGGASAILKMRQKCTVCNLQVEAIAFCSTCDAYMCDQCCVGHKQLKLFFDGHEIVSIHDIVEGNFKPGNRSEKCSAHRQENKHIFCQVCKIRVCFKCVIIDHRDHKIQSHEDFEKEIQVKVSDLLHRCKAKKSELEKNIQTVETHRHEAHTALQLLRADVGRVCRTKVKQLEDNRCALVEKIDALVRSFDEALNSVKSKDERKIKSIFSSLDLVANDRLGCLEADSLDAHTFLCEEIDGLLKEVLDQTSASAIEEKARKQRFTPAEDTSLDLGNISETEAKPALDGILKGASDDTSAATIGEEAQEKRSQWPQTLVRPQLISQPKPCVIDIKSGVHLYHAVDEQDRVYVASFDQNTGQVLIRLYELDGLNLKERGRFSPLEVKSQSPIH